MVKRILNGIKKYKTELDKLSNRICLNPVNLYFDCLWAYIRYGCVINQYIHGHFYKLRPWERKRIFTYREWKRIIYKANAEEAIHYMKNKVDFNTFYSDYVKRDWLYSQEMTREEFDKILSAHFSLIVKPVDGLEGGGIKLINSADILSLTDAYNTYRQMNVLFEEKICQHPDMIFGNESVNTIRVYTIYDDLVGEVYLLKTVLRVGIGDSIVDNSHSGGCAYEVDKETGYITSPSYCANGIVTYIHPKTDICMLGRKIPHWDAVVNICIDAAKMLPSCRFIGWDVAITSEGPLLIEGNHTPDLDMIEFVGNHGYKNVIRNHLHL